MPQPTLKQREIPYWSCGKESKGHFHTTEKFATRCMERIGKSRSAAWFDLHARNKAIVERLANGEHQSRIAKDLNISAGRVGQLVSYIMRICQSNPHASWYRPRLIDGDRFTDQYGNDARVTFSLTLAQMRRLVALWTTRKNRNWIFLDELSDKYLERDGPPLYRFSDEEIQQMFSCACVPR